MITNKKHISSIFFLMVSLIIYGQQTKNLEGRVFSKNGDVAGTHVLNISSQKATITGAEGFFSITVRLNDTLVFSAIQFRRKELVVNPSIFESRLLNVFLEEGEIKLDEVLVMPYNLTGELSTDLDSLKIDPSVTASSLGLPNAHVIPPTQSQRKLYTARTWDFKGTKVTIDPIFNYFSGRTKMLKKRVAREAANKEIESTRNFYVDSLFVHGLGIPKNRITDFMYFCEVDSTFQSKLDSNDKLKIWEFMRKKSATYRKINTIK